MKSVNAQAILSRHAQDRMATLLIPEYEVRGALGNPLSVFPGGPLHPPGRMTVVGRHILVVLAGDTVVTVKLRSDVPYVHGVHDRLNYPLPTTTGMSAA